MHKDIVSTMSAFLDIKVKIKNKTQKTKTKLTEQKTTWNEKSCFGTVLCKQDVKGLPGLLVSSRFVPMDVSYPG